MMILVHVYCLWLQCGLICQSICFSYYSSISYSDVCVTYLTIFLSTSVKWHVIIADLLSIVHFPVCLATVLFDVYYCAFV